MRVGEVRTLAGPNVYSYRPVLSMKLDLEELAGRESHEIPGFNKLLLELMPGLAEHRCSEEREGGFVERLREGTYFGHIVEHVALELTELASRSFTARPERLRSQAPTTSLSNTRRRREPGVCC